jgi:sugar O-acyltransferase (sialic acid O-acetyltransferase NeuD family)
MKRLALLGASGHGKVVADAAIASGWDQLEFFDDRWPALATVGDYPVNGDVQELLEQLDRFDAVFVSIGECRIRWQKQQVLRDAGASVATIVHPNAWVSPSARIGPGTVVMAGAVVQAGAIVGESCIINTGASVDHDCFLGAAVHVAPGARLAGEVEVGDHCWIGLGACIRQGVRMGKDVMVGAGAVVVKDFGDDLTLVGCPARPMNRAGGVDLKGLVC